jgi:hypothetical protein
VIHEGRGLSIAAQQVEGVGVNVKDPLPPKTGILTADGETEKVQDGEF